MQECGLRIDVIDADCVGERVAVQRAAFERSTFTEQSWRAMAEGPLYADARCLVAYDDVDVAVAAVTAWSAGIGRPGLLEPMGVHREYRGRGYRRAICLAAAQTLRELGVKRHGVHREFQRRRRGHVRVGRIRRVRRRAGFSPRRLG